MDPLGNVPFFSVVISKIRPERRVRVLVRELAASLLLILFFMFAGGRLLGALNLREESLKIAGGLILFLIALEMIFKKGNKGKIYEDEDSEPFIVPLATPMIAGPGIFASLVIFSRSYQDFFWELLLAVTGAWLVSSVMLLFSPYAERVFKRRGLAVMEKLTGMILIVLAIQMSLEGVKAFFLGEF